MALVVGRNALPRFSPEQLQNIDALRQWALTHPDSVGALLKVGENLGQMSEIVQKSRGGQATMPPVPATPVTRDLGTVAKLCQFKLVIDTPQVRSATFAIPEGMKGSEVLAKVEAANPRPTPGDGLVWPQSAVLKDKKVRRDLGLKAGEGGRQVTVTIVWDTLRKNWDTQVQIMQRNNLIPISDADLLLTAALFRDLKDYPRNPDGTEDRNKIGSTEDSGDFFKGKWVRGESGGARFGALSCFHGGLCGGDWDGGYAYDAVAAAGSPNPKS